MIIITVVAERKTPRQLTDSKQGRTETQTNETETANPEAKTKRSEPSASLSQNSLSKKGSLLHATAPMSFIVCSFHLRGNNIRT